MTTTEEWLLLARQDVNIVKQCAKAPEALIEDVSICYHVAQSIEKGLKALIQNEGEDPPWIHVLTELRDTYTDLSHEKIPHRFSKELEHLKPCEIDVKYEIDIELPYTRKELVDLAVDFFDWVTEKVSI